MFFHSLVSVLICGCTPFLCLLAILFIYQLLFHIFPFIKLSCDSKNTGPCIYFLLFLPSNLSMSSDFSFCSSSSAILDLLCHFVITIIFPPVPRGPSGMSLNILIFSCTGVRFYFFQSCCLFSGVPFLVFCWSFLNLFPYC